MENEPKCLFNVGLTHNGHTCASFIASIRYSIGLVSCVLPSRICRHQSILINRCDVVSQPWGDAKAICVQCTLPLVAVT